MMKSEAINDLVAGQRAFFQDGHTLPPEFRRLALKILGQAIKDHEPDILRALWEDLGKSANQAYLTEIRLVKKELELARRRVKRWLRPARPFTPLELWPAQSRVISRPRGLALIFAPWNYPFQLSLTPLIAALAAGNCAVLKPSELAPATALLLAKLLNKVFPAGLVRVVNGGPETAAELLDCPFDFIFYTGGQRVGRLVAERAARSLTPTVLELGGKCPALITRSASLASAAKRIIWGKLLNAGQTCVAPDYVLVPRELKGDFLKLLAYWAVKLYGPDPLVNPEYGRIINEKHFNRLLGYLADGTPFIPSLSDRRQLKIGPVLLTGVNENSPVMTDEIFGPVLPILPYDHLGEALGKIAARPAPLALYLFSHNRAEADLVWRSLKFGGGALNDVVIGLANPNLPFGGIGPSGEGRYHGRAGFEAFSYRQSLLINRSGWELPLRYPPYPKWLEFFLRRF